MKQKVIQLYEHFFQISAGNPNFDFKPKENENKVIDNFVKKLTLSHGEEWLFNYFCYQFSRYYNLKTRFGKGVVMISWILGKKALNKYSEASEEEKYWGDVFKERFNIRNPLFKRQTIEIDISYHNRERTRFKQSERQLIHCSEMNLFNEKNKICMFCKNRNICKEIK